MLNDFVLARVLHLLAVLWWLGGVLFVTAVLLPALRRHVAPDRQYPLFETLEHRFARQARVATLAAGASGVYLLAQSGGLARLAASPWLIAMVALWSAFAAMLFVLEPWLLHRLLAARASRDAAGTMRRLQALHVALSLASLAVFAAGVAGAHGGLS